MRILLPVDGSAASLNAARKAAEIAKKDGYSIKMISVIKLEDLQVYKRYSKIWQQADGSVFDPKVKVIDDDQAVNMMVHMAGDQMDSIIAKSDLAQVQLEKEVLIGEPFEKILETAENENIDLIVMGNRGFSKTKRFFVGSVTQRVVSDAPCPVLVVPTAEKE